ncbi:MAG: hypothetical protein PHD12_06190 [Methylotenera sp.]|nr:hypothetical protein [Methylotenera sp.]
MSDGLMKIENFTKRSKIALTALVVLMFSACSTVKNPDAPVPVNFPHALQPQLQASQHWATVAEDIADQVVANLKEKKLLNKPLYVNPQSTPTEFGKALNDFLITHLVQKGVEVSSVSEKSVVLNYKTQVVKFKSSRNVLLPSQLKWTTLAGGLVVGRLLADAVDINSFDATVLVGGGLFDFWQANKAPKLELVVTSSIMADHLYVSRTTNVYYANSVDSHLYERAKLKSKSKSNGPFDDPFYQISK